MLGFWQLIVPTTHLTGQIVSWSYLTTREPCKFWNLLLLILQTFGHVVVSWTTRTTTMVEFWRNLYFSISNIFAAWPALSRYSTQNKVISWHLLHLNVKNSKWFETTLFLSQQVFHKQKLVELIWFIYRVFQKKYLIGFDIEIDISLLPMQVQKCFWTFLNCPVFVDCQATLDFIPMGIFYWVKIKILQAFSKL